MLHNPRLSRGKSLKYLFCPLRVNIVLQTTRVDANFSTVVEALHESKLEKLCFLVSSFFDNGSLIFILIYNNYS